MRTLTMARIIILLGWLSTGLLAATLVFRYPLVPEGGGASRIHVLAAVVASLLAVLAHSWILLFLLGSGRVVGRSVSRNALDPLLAESGRRLRLRVLPWPALAAMAVTLLFVLRSGVLAIVWPPPVETSAAALVVGLQVATWIVTMRAARRNESILDEIAARLASV